jgi:hypothetical protein
VPAFYSSSVPDFLSHEEELVIGRQTAITQQGFSELSAEQLDAWQEQCLNEIGTARIFKQLLSDDLIRCIHKTVPKMSAIWSCETQ